ncbi:MAG: tripartite tricarboxylate transporter TctB family protein [Deltaproteobacteria bacterium]|nr:tripartite tricarboxylate transporter TctB family protein [Deltaproteobacteria bacterium]
MKKGLIIVSIILMGMSLLGMIESSKLERTMKMGIGINFLPFWMCAIIGALALTLFVKALRGRITDADKPVFPKENMPRVVFMAIFLLAYLIVFEIIGYTYATFLFFAAMIFFLQRSRMMGAVFFGAVFTALLYAIFKLWLKSPLPSGPFGI